MKIKMTKEVVFKLHKLSLGLLLLFYIAGFFVSGVFYDGNPDAAFSLWFLGVSVYIPFYILYSEFKGVISLPRSGSFSKDEARVGFRFVQVLYGAISAFIFINFCKHYFN